MGSAVVEVETASASFERLGTGLSVTGVPWVGVEDDLGFPAPDFPLPLLLGR